MLLSQACMGTSLSGSDEGVAGPPVVTASGRTLYRHPNGKGTVIEFTMTPYGKPTMPMKIFVADAKYRTALKWGAYGLNSTIPVLDTTYLSSSSRIGKWDRDAQITGGFTDSQIIKLDQFSNSYGSCRAQPRQSARFTCDAWLNNVSPTYVDKYNVVGLPVLNYCRSLTDIFPEGLDIPTLFELCVIYVESDNLDTLDPTMDEYGQYGLGRNPVTKRRRFTFPGAVGSNHVAFACNKYRDSHVAGVSDIGYIQSSGCYRPENKEVIPIRELIEF